MTFARHGRIGHVVIVSAGIVLGATVRGGELVPEPMGAKRRGPDT
jgi:hypothetical protein